MSRRRSPKSDPNAEKARKKYYYRTMVIRDGVKLPARLAMKLVGPDCAFHLYRHESGAGEAEDRKGREAEG